MLPSKHGIPEIVAEKRCLPLLTSPSVSKAPIWGLVGATGQLGSLTRSLAVASPRSKCRPTLPARWPDHRRARGRARPDLPLTWFVDRGDSIWTSDFRPPAERRLVSMRPGASRSSPMHRPPWTISEEIGRCIRYQCGARSRRRQSRFTQSGAEDGNPVRFTRRDPAARVPKKALRPWPTPRATPRTWGRRAWRPDWAGRRHPHRPRRRGRRPMRFSRI